jgi:hypothetical protein
MPIPWGLAFGFVRLFRRAQGEHGLGFGQPQGVAVSAGEKLDLAIDLAGVAFKLHGHGQQLSLRDSGGWSISGDFAHQIRSPAQETEQKEAAQQDIYVSYAVQEWHSRVAWNPHRTETTRQQHGWNRLWGLPDRWLQRRSNLLIGTRLY